MYAPLYVSNECIDTCRYCGFSRENQIVRKTLSVEEVLQEAAFLMTEGFRHLLLVSGEHPRIVSLDYLSSIARRLKPRLDSPASPRGERLARQARLASLSIEVAPFDESTYRNLREVGVDGVVIYQETYDREVYERVHLAGPKKNYAHRLAAPEEAARAGIRKIGMGILVGLLPWERDFHSLIDHVRWMKKRYWQTEFTVSLPRLRPCASNYEAPFPVTDEEYLEMIGRLRVALPDVGIVLSTRERAEFRHRLIAAGVTHMSAGSRTEPGGYLHPQEAEGQFEIEDRRSAAEVAAAIRARGYEPVWKDWESIL